MPKIIIREYGTIKLHEHWCPGCEMMHQIAVNQPFSNGAQWSFDGNFEKPTFSPSVNISMGSRRCHYFLKSGMLQLLSDSTHKLAGQTVALPDIPENELE